MYGIKLNNIHLYFNKNYTVLQACLEAKIDVPFFCYHEKLGIAVIAECV